MKINFILLIFISLTCAAEDHFLYRVDTRPPSVIFTYGFTSPGENRSILQHIRGQSCRGTGPHSNSAYISATADFYFARNYAYRLSGNLAQDPVAVDAYTYIYRIRQTTSFYETSRLLNRLRQGSRSTTIRRQANSALPTAADQAEWIAEGAVPPQDIHSVVQIHYRQLAEGSEGSRIILNPAYRFDPQRAGINNADVIPGANEEETISVLYFRFGPDNIISTCLSGLLWCAHTNTDERLLVKGEPSWCPSQSISIMNNPPLSAELNKTLLISP